MTDTKTRPLKRIVAVIDVDDEGNFEHLSDPATWLDAQLTGQKVGDVTIYSTAADAALDEILGQGAFAPHEKPITVIPPIEPREALETPRMLVLSTAHITHRTSLILDGKRPGPKPLLYPKGEYGWFIPIIDPLGYDSGEDVRWSLPDLLAIRQFAQAAGCGWIMLDCDGDTLEGLPTYEW